MANNLKSGVMWSLWVISRKNLLHGNSIIKDNMDWIRNREKAFDCNGIVKVSSGVSWMKWIRGRRQNNGETKVLDRGRNGVM